MDVTIGDNFNDVAKNADNLSKSLDGLVKKITDVDASAKKVEPSTAQATKGVKDMGEAASKSGGHFFMLIKELLEGRNVIQTLAAQGPDIVSAFGGMGGAISAVGSILMSTTGIILAAGAAIGFLAYKHYEAIKAANEFQNALTEMGMAGEISGAQFTEMAEKLGKGGEEALAGAAKMGAEGEDALNAFAEASIALKNVTGKSLEEIQQQFKGAAEAPLQFALAHKDALHKMTQAQLNEMAALNSAGDKAGALTVMMKAQTEYAKLVADAHKQAAVETRGLGSALISMGLDGDTSISILNHLGLVSDDYKNKVNELKKSLLEKRNAEGGGKADEYSLKNKALQAELGFQDQITQKQVEAAQAGRIGDAVTQASIQSKAKQLEIEKKIAAVQNDTSDPNAAGKGMKIASLQKEMDANKQLGAIEVENAQRQLDLGKLVMAQQTAALTERNTLTQKAKQLTIDLIGTDQTYATQMKNNLAAEQTAESQIFDLDQKITAEKLKGTIQSQAQVVEYQKQKVEITNNLAKTKELNAAEAERIKSISQLTREYNQLLSEQSILVVTSSSKYDLIAQGQTTAVKNQQLFNNSTIEFALAIANAEVSFARLADSGKWKGTEQAFTTMLNDLKELSYIPTNIGGIELGLKPDQIEKNAQRRMELQNQINALIKESGSEEARDIISNTQLARAKYDKELIDIKRTDEAIKKKNASMAEGAKEAFDKIQQSMTPFQQSSDMVNATWMDIGGFIDKFVDGAKPKFSDLASSIIKDLLRIEMKAEAMQLWKIINGATTGGGSSGGSLIGAAAKWIGGFFADGGEPPVGVPSMVGERGPELFVPKTAGTIIPNSALSNMGGSTNQTVQNTTHNTYITNQVSALDAKGVAQLLQENKRMLFGIVESARRELPIGAR